MGYTQQTWADGSGGATPVIAASLNHMEVGIKDASNRLDAFGTGITTVLPSGDTSGATDVAAINAAITTANSSSGGTVQLQAGTYWINAPIILRSNVTLQGTGAVNTVVKTTAASNCDVLQGTGFSGLTLSGTAPFAGGVSGSIVRDLLIDGNSANQTTPGYGYRVYGFANFVRNVIIRNCLTGIWHECGPLSTQDGPTNPGSECEFSNIRIYLSQSHGMMLLGPSDCVVTDVTIGFSNGNIAAAGIGFWGLCDQKSNILATSSAMNGTTVAGFTGTFTVQAAQLGGATDLYAATGTLAVATSSGTATVTYTGKTATTFTGCTVTSGSGTFATGNAVTTSGAQKFTTNGLLLSQVHPYGCSQTWGFVLDGTTTTVNCHSDGTSIGGVLARGSLSWHGGEIYDFTPTTVSCGMQLGDAGATFGVPTTATLSTSQCDIVTSVVGFQFDQASRSAIRWVNASQSRASIKAVTQTTGTHTVTLASGSNGVDVSTFTGGSPGTLFVTSTNNVPTTGGGTLTVATALGAVTCTYTGTNAAANTTTSRPAGSQFTGVVAVGAASGSTMSTGGTVTQVNMGTVGVGGTVDTVSRIDVHVSSSALSAATAASQERALGPYVRDLGSAGNAFQLRANGTDLLNINSVNGQIQIPNARQLLLYSDNYTTKTVTVDGNTGVTTGPSRGGSALTFPGPLWVPGDHGLITASGDPEYAAANSVVATAGTVYHTRVHCPVSFSATNVVLYIVTAGVILTSGQCFAGLYHAGAGGALIATTADLSSGANSFATGGAYTLALSGGPYTNLAAGDYTIAFFFNGTTGPALARFGNVASGLPNMGLASSTYRHFIDSTNTGRTTSLPATIGTQTTNGVAWFAGIS